MSALQLIEVKKKLCGGKVIRYHVRVHYSFP